MALRGSQLCTDSSNMQSIHAELADSKVELKAEIQQLSCTEELPPG